MFRALLAHSQETLHKRHLEYFVCVMSVGWTKNGVPLLIINALCMFRVLRADRQEVLHKRHLEYCLCVVSWLAQELSFLIKN
jgi:hypothetical protein